MRNEKLSELAQRVQVREERKECPGICKYFPSRHPQILPATARSHSLPTKWEEGRMEESDGQG